jgi:hypothetical protein
MHPFIDYSIRTLQNIKIQLLIGILSFFIIALILSTIPGEIYIILWLIIGVFTIYFIRLTFPYVWNYTFWLIGIFLVNFLAVLCLLQTKFTDNLLLIPIGIFLELVSLWIGVKLILRIKDIRDDISGVTERPDGLELAREAAYVPIGFWSLIVFIFWVFSNLSIYYWYTWSVGNWGPEPYLIANLILLFSTVYILWHPQMHFDWGVETVLLPSKDLKAGANVLAQSQRLIPRIKKTVSISGRPSVKCPICGAKTVTEQRVCKHCGKPRVFNWCKINEGYIVTCPHCKAQTSYGKEYCIKCGKPINRLVRCSCGEEHEIREWEFRRSVKM